jgi:ketosteroid isomerase-like protein
MSMSQHDNVAVVRRVYDGFLRKDLPAILELQAEDAEWSVAGSSDLIPWAGPSRGRQGVTDFLRTLGQWLVAEQFEIQDYLSSDDKVVALGYQRGQVRPTGKPYEFDFVHVWTLRDSRIASFRVYYDTAYVGSVLGSGPPAA